MNEVFSLQRNFARGGQVLPAAPVHGQEVPAGARPHHRRRVRCSHDQHRGEADQAPDLGHGGCFVKDYACGEFVCTRSQSQKRTKRKMQKPYQRLDRSDQDLSISHLSKCKASSSIAAVAT